MQEVMDMDVVDTTLSRQMNKREAAITKMTLVVYIGFWVCFLPTTAIVVFDPTPGDHDKLDYPNRDNPELHVAGYIIFWCSAFINPVIYIASNKVYRRALKDVICCNIAYDEVSTAPSRATSNPASRNTSFLSMSSFRSSKRFRNFRNHNINDNDDDVHGIAMYSRTTPS